MSEHSKDLAITCAILALLAIVCGPVEWWQFPIFWAGWRIADYAIERAP